MIFTTSPIELGHNFEHELGHETLKWAKLHKTYTVRSHCINYTVYSLWSLVQESYKVKNGHEWVQSAQYIWSVKLPQGLFSFFLVRVSSFGLCWSNRKGERLARWIGLL